MNLVLVAAGSGYLVDGWKRLQGDLQPPDVQFLYSWIVHLLLLVVVLVVVGGACSVAADND